MPLYRSISGSIDVEVESWATGQKVLIGNGCESIKVSFFIFGASLSLNPIQI
jgi:hypothetical protein